MVGILTKPKSFTFLKMKIVQILTGIHGIPKQIVRYQNPSYQKDKKCKGYNHQFRDTLLKDDKYKNCHENLKVLRIYPSTHNGVQILY